ncbi:hypothetical protein NA66_1012174 [Burkholderia pyrrocinia]|uniref:Uncharacterized protein n=1 Tax=Burkholderia pyrrocinia TaxID=60550 RepID=A0A318J2S0_BURPY|nr:hypothetical protein NA66_1012174 [Burkholderia pyrrocinia]SFW42999.1 hypothetical protein SAMN03159384_02015 [Burkholderia sp. NFACC33-1]SFX73834.1 hypothetical protein SAMN03159408_02097 [Burkholderia sp. NFPP32]
MGFPLESWNGGRCDERVVRDGISIVRMRDGFSGCIGIGSFAGWAPPSCRYAPAGPARRLGLGRPGFGAAGRTTSRSRRRPRACLRAGGGRRQGPCERRGASSRRACARQGFPGVRLSNRGVAASGDGADRVGASDVDGAKSRRRHQRMRDRSSERSRDARQQPCDGRNDFRHDFPDFMIVCRLHRAARPCSRFCLHGCMSKRRASARIAARTGTERSLPAAVQRGGGGNVSGVKPAAAEPVGGAPGLVRNGLTDGGSQVRRDGDSAGETDAPRRNGFSLATRAGRGGGASPPFRSGAGCAARHAFAFDCASSHAQNCATSGSSAGARGAIHQ